MPGSRAARRARALLAALAPLLALAQRSPRSSRPSPGAPAFALPPAAASSCQKTVFSGLAVDCNLDAGGSASACCARLGAADADACFCDGAIVATVEAIIGAEGLDFFRVFAETECERTLRELDSGTCPRPVTTLQQVPGGQDDYDDGEGFAGTTRPAVPAFPGFPPFPNEAPPGQGTTPGGGGGGEGVGAPPVLGGPGEEDGPSPVEEGGPAGLDAGEPSATSDEPSAPGLNGPSDDVSALLPAPPPPRLPFPPGAPQLAIPPPAPQLSRAPFPPPTPPSYRRKIPGLPTIAELLSGDKVDREVGVFSDALAATGLLPLFDGEGPFTVFAPTNRAWYEALSDLGATKEEVFQDPALTEVLTYHASRSEVYTHGMFFGQKIPTMHATAPSVARAMRDAVSAGAAPADAYAALTEGLEVEVFSGVFHRAFFVDGCDVRRANAQASNGVVHVIDCVLVPPAPQPLPTRRTVAQVLVERFELSVFEQALTGGGLLRAVASASPTNPLTVFAPTNAAFIKYLATDPGFFIDTPAERAANPGRPGLQETLLYHFVPARLTAAQMSTHVANRLRTFEGGEVFVERYEGRGARSGAWGGFGGGLFGSNKGGVFGSSGKERLFVNGCATRAVDFVCADGVVHTIECVLRPNFRDDLGGKWFGDTSGS